MSNWHVDQVVSVEPRTWAGINRSGGVGKIVKIHYADGSTVQSVDVKYILGGIDTQLDLDFVRPHVELERQGRSRRGRDFYQASPAKRARSKANEEKKAAAEKKESARGTTKKAGKKNSATALKARNPGGDKEDLPTSLAHTVPVRNVVVSDTAIAVSPLPDPPSSRHQSNKASVAVQKDPRSKFEKLSLKEQQPNAKKTILQPAQTSARDVVAIQKKASKQRTDMTERQKIHASSKKRAEKSEKTIKTTSVEPISKADPSKLTTAASLAPTNKSAPKADGLETFPSSRVPLQQVYDNQYGVASDFVNDIVGKPEKAARKPPPAEIEGGIPSSSSSMDASRRSVFTSIFGEVLSRNEGSFEMNQILREVNRRASPSLSKLSVSTPFTSTEMDSCMEYLSAQDKIMISGGTVYSMC